MLSLQSRRTVRWCVAFLALGLVAWTAGAADLVLHLPGVTGDSTTPGHVGDIRLSSMQFNVTNPDRTNVMYSEVTLTKYQDNATVPLAGLATVGANLNSVTIYQTLTNGTPTNVMTLQLHDVIVSGQTQGGVAGEGPLQETITLNAASFTWSYGF